MGCLLDNCTSNNTISVSIYSYRYQLLFDKSIVTDERDMCRASYSFRMGKPSITSQETLVNLFRLRNLKKEEKLQVEG